MTKLQYIKSYLVKLCSSYIDENGVLRSGENDAPVRGLKPKQRPSESHVLDILSQIKGLSGITELVELNSLSNGAVGLFEHEDGQRYEISVLIARFGNYQDMFPADV